MFSLSSNSSCLSRPSFSSNILSNNLSNTTSIQDWTKKQFPKPFTYPHFSGRAIHFKHEKNNQKICEIDQNGNTAIHRFLLSLTNFPNDLEQEQFEVYQCEHLLKVSPESLNHQNNNGVSLPLLSVYKQRYHLLKLFLRKKGDPTLSTQCGDTAMKIALYRRNPHLCELLLDYGDDLPNEFNPSRFYGKTTYNLQKLFKNNVKTETYWNHVKCAENRGIFESQSPHWQENSVYCAKVPRSVTLRTTNSQLDNLMSEIFNYFYEVYGLVQSSNKGQELLMTPMGREMTQENYEGVEKLVIEKEWCSTIEEQIQLARSGSINKITLTYCQASRQEPTHLRKESPLIDSAISPQFYQRVVRLMNANPYSGISHESECLRAFEQCYRLDQLFAVAMLRALKIRPETFSNYLLSMPRHHS